MYSPFVIPFEIRPNSNGTLSFLEEIRDVPFEIKRIYWLYDVPDQQVRGDHAHKTGEQVIICLQGAIEVVLESQNGELFNCTLDKPEEGLYIPPLWWGKMRFQNKAIMVGLASDEFSEEDYIRNRKDF